MRAGTQGRGWSCSICKVLHGGPRENGRGARVRPETSCSARSRTVGTTDKFLDPLSTLRLSHSKTPHHRGVRSCFSSCLCSFVYPLRVARYRAFVRSPAKSVVRTHDITRNLGAELPLASVTASQFRGTFGSRRSFSVAKCGAADCRGRLRGRRLLLPS